MIAIKANSIWEVHGTKILNKSKTNSVQTFLMNHAIWIKFFVQIAMYKRKYKIK